MRGNVTALKYLAMSYDMTDQMVSTSGRNMQQAAVNATYQYNGEGKRVYTNQNGRVSYPMYDAGGALAAVYKVDDAELVERISLQSGHPLAKWTGSTLTYLHADHLGTPIRGTHGLGTGATPGAEVFQDFSTPYGLNPTPGWHGNTGSGFDPATGPGSNCGVTGFTTHVKDCESGLTYMQARYYDPVVGRFLSIDPMTFMSTGDPNQFNRYVYGNNDPVNMIDPNGEDAFGFNFDFKVVVGGGVRVAGEVSYDVDTKQLRVQGIFGEHGGGKVKASGSVFTEPSSDRPDSISITSSAIAEGTAEIKLGGVGLGINPTASVDVTASSETGLTAAVDTGSWNPTAEAGPVSTDANGRTSFNVGGGLGLTAGVDHQVDINISLDTSWMEDLIPEAQR